MKDYWFTLANDLKEEVNYYIVTNNLNNFSIFKNSIIIPLKELKEFSKKFPNIKLYKEYLKEEIDEETMAFLEKNFNLIHLEKMI